jgi:hypothetical protein
MGRKKNYAISESTQDIGINLDGQENPAGRARFLPLRLMILFAVPSVVVDTSPHQVRL